MPTLTPRGTPIGFDENTDPIAREFGEFSSTPRGCHPNSLTQLTMTSSMSMMNFELLTHIKSISPRPILFVTGEHAHSRYFGEDAHDLTAEPTQELFSDHRAAEATRWDVAMRPLWSLVLVLIPDVRWVGRPIRARSADNTVNRMSNPAHKTSHDHALDVVQGYAHQDAVAVQKAVAGLDADGWAEAYALLSGLLRSTISIMELTGRTWKLDDLVRACDDIATAAPPHYEFAMAQSTRAWAAGDESAMRALSHRDIPGAVHMTAIGIATLGLALWGRAGFLDVLAEFHAAADFLTNDPTPGV